MIGQVDAFHVDGIPHLAMITANGDVETAIIGNVPKNVSIFIIRSVFGGIEREMPLKYYPFATVLKSVNSMYEAGTAVEHKSSVTVWHESVFGGRAQMRLNCHSFYHCRNELTLVLLGLLPKPRWRCQGVHYCVRTVKETHW